MEKKVAFKPVILMQDLDADYQILDLGLTIILDKNLKKLGIWIPETVSSFQQIVCVQAGTGEACGVLYSLCNCSICALVSSNHKLAKCFTLRSLKNVQCTLINFLKKSSLYALIKDL